MGRLVSEHFNPRGRPKRQYASWNEAVEAKTRRNQKVYRCSICRRWHIGRPPKRKSK